MGEVLDYKKLGLKCGIEIHRRLKTHKLFCNCDSLLEDEHTSTFHRYLRLSKSELGEIDPAALHEHMKGRKYIYRTYKKSTCLVEMDEEPPHEVNEEALKIVVEIALLLNAKIVDEVHFMRKIVIDGSNTTGFQRTAIIGLDGKLKCSFGDVPIPTICLEEESAQIIERGDDYVAYGLNRLGIPLVEIATEPVLNSPEKVVDAARKLGELLRFTGKVMRGIGSIRQDINISIKEGARVEIKGAQDLSVMEKLVENEVKRQKSLVEIKNELKGKKPKVSRIFDVGEVFKDTRSRLLKNKKALAITINNFSGMFSRKLNDFRTLGREVADYVRAKTKMKGIIHTDEDLSRYGISEGEVEALRKNCKASPKDLVVMVLFEKEDEREEAEKALEVVRERVEMLAEGVPEETRRALENGDTQYMRPLPGSARMYPETDVPPIFIIEDMIEETRANLPETPEEKMEKYLSLGIGKELATQLINSDYYLIFEEAVVKLKHVPPKVVAVTLVNTIPDLKSRENVDIDKLDDRTILSVLHLLDEGVISRDAIPIILKACVEEGKKPELVVKEKNLRKANKSEVENLVKELIKKHGEKASFKMIMGEVMKVYAGRIDGKDAVEIIKKALSGKQ